MSDPAPPPGPLPQGEGEKEDSPLPLREGIGGGITPDEESLRLAEALVFASAQPVSLRQLGQVLPDGVAPEDVAAALRARYAGRGVELVEVAGGVMFRTAPDLAPRLRTVIEVPRRVPRAAMETLAIIAYHQPLTRPEIETMRGASLAQATLDALLEAGLIAPAGRREAPGRPTLWATTPGFLTRFGLASLRDLPRREDLLVEPPGPVAAAEGEADTSQAAPGEAPQV
jgi:segregation and condensation protein B